jgi:RNA polymerase sigma-70 factor (ECF subfamily)
MEKVPQPPKSFVAVYNKLALPLTKFIVKHVGGDQQVAEEVFSRTVVAAYEGFHTFKYKSSYFTWLCRIALNKIADYYREQVNKRSGIIVPFLEEIAYVKDNKLTPDEKLALHELKASVRECLELLPAEKRQLLYLRYWRDLTIKQIAKQFGISERAVEGRIYRAKRLLKEKVLNKHPEIAKVYNKD